MALQTLDHPFSAGSIWNTPIGIGATFQSGTDTQTSSLRHSSNVVPWIQDSAMEIYQAKATDPLATWTYSSRAETAAWGANGGAAWGGSFQMRTPTDVQFATSDGWAIIVSEDGQRFYETWLGEYNAGSRTYSAGFIAANDLTGSGIAEGPGQHDGVRAAGVSLLGGLVREQELDNLDIPHAIAMAISTTQAKAGSQASTQMVWPATTVDAFGQDLYHGSIPIGALFAIPKEIDLSKIGLKTPEGLALAKAYQNYGGYVVDTAGDRTDNLAYVETGASSQQVENMRADVAAIRAQLAMVTNNSAADPGGPGAPVVTPPVVTPPVAPDPGPVTPPVAPPVVPPVVPPVTPPSAGNGTSVTVGSGPDSLVIKVSEQAYKGDAQFTVSVDGKQIGGTLTAHASHAAGLSDTVTVQGDWGAGNHTVAVNFVNDKWDGTAATDRNLYVDSATYNGVAVAGAKLDLHSGGAEQFVFRDIGTPGVPSVPDSGNGSPVPGATATIGTGADVILLKVSEHAYRGHAQFTVSVDGQQIGGTLTARASHADGQFETIAVRGNWAAGDHDVALDFINDRWGGSAATDRNLYLDGATYNGIAVQGAARALESGGAEHFVIHDYAV